MAKRRMISSDIFETDFFNDLPASSQSLYTHFILQADDDGIIKNPKMLLRMYNANEDNLNVLIGKRLLISFDDGAVVITHWKMMNAIRKDRYTPTIFQDDYQQLYLDDNNVYHLNWQPDNNQMATNRQPSDNQLSTKSQLNRNQTVAKRLPNGCQSVIPSVDKNKLVKNKLVKNNLFQPKLKYK